ncbi:3-dehydroquinate synthase [Flavobacteriaceae bacterium F89]|uniref:3-dehydroquinate synthase n=1 Tax=Cerina litoralis TaxID=2874477 RepID=A0AAE3EWY1_9FLAO|nr:3-dehydroquinate synthase [Cerina litoralis]MCG2461854.1 3-dehydroquinate synthase [Cerina litoralis]
MKKFNAIQQTFKVEYSYQLQFTKDLFGTDNPLFHDIFANYRKKGGVKVLFVVDDGVIKAHPTLKGKIISYCQKFADRIVLTEILVVTGGEETKNDHDNVLKVLQGVNDNHIDRHSFVVAVGGGAVIDMAGYAAAIAHRGVKLIRIPTTTLSQNDSAVGVKNSINIFNKKNFLGTFAPPFAIINDIDFLPTLEHRDWISGVAEAVKVALIKDDKFFGFLEKNAVTLYNREMEPMEYLIYRCAEMHMEHIAQGGDPFETGSSRPLDFGHWAAHKLEYMTDYKMRHGEAVAVGMALDLTYAHLIGLIDEQTLKRVLNVLETIGFDLHIPLETEDEWNVLLGGIEEFREHLGGQLTITLISNIGFKHDVHEIDLDKMRDAINVLNNLCQPKIC